MPDETQQHPGEQYADRLVEHWRDMIDAQLARYDVNAGKGGMADATGVAASTISEVRSQRHPSFSDFANICAFLGVEIRLRVRQDRAPIAMQEEEYRPAGWGLFRHSRPDNRFQRKPDREPAIPPPPELPDWVIERANWQRDEFVDGAETGWRNAMDKVPDMVRGPLKERLWAQLDPETATAVYDSVMGVVQRAVDSDTSEDLGEVFVNRQRDRIDDAILTFSQGR